MNSDNRDQDAPSLTDALSQFYQRSGFGEKIGQREALVPVYTGCILVPLPNIETRHRYLKYHDIHHLITGYSVGRIGEGEVSAWELGTGSAFHSPILALMNLIALSTGLVLEPGRMWRAFRRGCRSRNLYSSESRLKIDNDYWENLATLQTDTLESGEDRIPAPLRVLEFVVYSGFALIIHALIAIPAVIVRLITDISLGMSIFQAVKPKKRADLY